MRDARIDLTWADGDYSFRLGWGELAELQEKCNAGPYVVLNRLQSGEWRMEDISNVIRLGLIGAGQGMTPVRAVGMVRRYVEDRPPLENLFIATVILQAGLMGAPEEPVGESAAANPKVDNLTISQTEKSDLPPSMEPEPSLGSRRRKSTK